MNKDNSKLVLIFGIIGIACSFEYYGAIIGLVFSILALVQYKKFTAAGGVDKKATIGKNLAIAGLIISIIMLVICIIVTIVIAAAAGAAAQSGLLDSALESISVY